MSGSPDLHICFVCTGNICRSPMGDVIGQHFIDEAGLHDRVKVNSCGIGAWHVGQGADPRAVNELAAHGYDGSMHRAAQFGDEHAHADLFLAMDQGHIRDLHTLGVEPQRIRLMRSFDPNSPADAEVDDPYYGSPKDFTRAREEIEASMPGLMEWVKEALD
ncbi:MAG: low molecular weight protein-tyrosine-phosphatase [Corynebacterium sp.]|nr:low molecular weight protein-tyrosine-phosphatase [Corynebacterium sp.]